MLRRFNQILLLVSILWIAWLLMMLVHESGHVLGAIVTGGMVRRFIWHPAVLSRTDVFPNPHPVIEVWAGPVFGSIALLIIALFAHLLRLRIDYLIWAIAGFCLIANGAYIGIGSIFPVGDGKELIAFGTPRWILALFGLITVLPGFYIWHRISPRFGLGKAPLPVRASHVFCITTLAILFTLAGFVFGNPGN
jgi:hypothetical protein